MLAGVKSKTVISNKHPSHTTSIRNIPQASVTLHKLPDTQNQLTFAGVEFKHATSHKHPSHTTSFRNIPQAPRHTKPINVRGCQIKKRNIPQASVTQASVTLHKLPEAQTTLTFVSVKFKEATFHKPSKYTTSLREYDHDHHQLHHHHQQHHGRICGEAVGYLRRRLHQNVVSYLRGWRAGIKDCTDEFKHLVHNK